MKKTLLTMGLTLVLIFSSACSKEAKSLEKENSQLVLGIRQNTKAPDLSKANEEIEKALKTAGSLGVTVADGSPYLAFNIDIPEIDQSLAKAKQEKIEKAYYEEIKENIAVLKPKTGEANILDAINISSKNLADKEGKKELIIMDSGLSTSGLLNFSEGYLENIDPDQVVEALKERNALPNLEGIKVTWYGLGQTAGGQEKPSEKSYRLLLEIWERILQEAGAQDIYISKEIINTKDPEDSDFPKVSKVNFVKEENIIIDSLDEPVIFDEEEIAFKSGTADLLTSKDQVKEKLSDIANILKEKKDKKILLAGTTATYGSQASCVDLSYQRCETIKNIFLEMGIEKDRIEMVGLGFENHPFHKEDIMADGSLDEKIAQKNRSVIVVPMDSDLAKELLVKKGGLL